MTVNIKMNKQSCTFMIFLLTEIGFWKYVFHQNSLSLLPQNHFCSIIAVPFIHFLLQQVIYYLLFYFILFYFNL